MGANEQDDASLGESLARSHTAATVTSSGPLSRPRRASLVPGSRLGRYEILEKLGAGGMGVVYRAHDPDLDRQIALKLLIARESGDGAALARERLLREAQALAQLSHPNVVAAHDVGIAGDDVFVAMELVEGQSLRQWLRQRRPSRKAIIAAMIAAGRGLAAAHAAGLVHRDFKPGNILLGDDGRPRVVDFGLARAAGVELSAITSTARSEAAVSDSEDSPSDASARRLDSPLTLAGSVLGTPAYMAPEQYLGDAVDARADQFAFCVTLYEALYGVRPFASSKDGTLRDNVVSGSRTAPPAGVHVPRRVRRVLDRGLEPSPDARFPSMDALLDALAYDPTPRRRILAIAALTAIGTSLAIGSATTAPGAVCETRADRLAGVWDDDVSARILTAFMATGHQHGRTAFTRLDDVLDRYADGWIRAHTQACEATHVRGEQSAAMLDLRMACLDSRRDELEAFTGLLSGEIDDAVVDNAVPSAYRLTDVDVCADTRRLAVRAPPPVQPAARAAVGVARKQLDHARALELAGRYQEGLSTALTAAAAARQADYSPLTADAALVLALLQRRTGDDRASAATLREAMAAAATARDDHAFARASLDLLYSLGPIQSHYESALALGPVVDALITRAGAPATLRADADATLGYVLLRSGDPRAAEIQMTRALSLFEQAYGPQHPQVAHALNYLAILYGSEARYEESRTALERAIGIWGGAYGPEHPRLIAGLTNLGSTLAAEGNHAEALPHLTKALTLAEESLGHAHPKVGHALTGLAEVHRNRGDCDRAEPLYRRAVALYEASFGLEHAYLAYPLNGLGLCRVEDGRPDDAIPFLERAARLRANGSSTERASTSFALARAYVAAGRNHRHARTLAAEARAAYEAAGPGAKADAAAVEAWLLGLD